jgi:hypothetical protein
MLVLHAMPQLGSTQLVTGQWAALRGSAEEALALSISAAQRRLSAVPLGLLTLLAARQGRPADRPTSTTRCWPTSTRRPDTRSACSPTRSTTCGAGRKAPAPGTTATPEARCSIRQYPAEHAEPARGPRPDRGPPSELVTGSRHCSGLEQLGSSPKAPAGRGRWPPSTMVARCSPNLTTRPRSSRALWLTTPEPAVAPTTGRGPTLRTVRSCAVRSAGSTPAPTCGPHWRPSRTWAHGLWPPARPRSCARRGRPPASGPVDPAPADPDGTAGRRAGRSGPVQHGHRRPVLGVAPDRGLPPAEHLHQAGVTSRGELAQLDLG